MVAFGTVEPLAACGCEVSIQYGTWAPGQSAGRTAGGADGDLGVEDVFAGDGISQAHGITGESWKLPHVTERVNVYAPPDRCAVLCFRVSSSQRFRAWRVGEVNKDWCPAGHFAVSHAAILGKQQQQARGRHFINTTG